MRQLLWAICGILGVTALLSAAPAPIPPAPVQDDAKVGIGTAAATLARLEAYGQQTHHQLIVWIGKTTGNDSIEDWSAES